MKSKKAGHPTLMMITIIFLVLASMSPITYANTEETNAGYLYVNGVAVEDFFDVYPGVTYSIKVCDLPPDIDSGHVLIRVSDESEWHEMSVIDGYSDPFDWTAPEAPEGTTYVVRFKDADLDPAHFFIAHGITKQVGHLFVIPEFPLGTGMSVLVMITSLAAFSILKSQNIFNIRKQPTSRAINEEK